MKRLCTFFVLWFILLTACTSAPSEQTKVVGAVAEPPTREVTVTSSSLILDTQTNTPKSTETATAVPPTETVTPTPTEAPSSTPTEVPKQETITFELTDGTTLEMPQFQTTEEALDFVEKNTLWRTGNKSKRCDITVSWLDKAPDGWTFFKKIKIIPGYQLVFGTMLTFPKEGDSFFTLNNYKVNGGKTLLVYENTEDKLEAVYVDMDSSDFVKQLPQFQFAAPTPQP